MESAEAIRQLRAARSRTRRVVDDLAGERELGPKLAIVNPPRWEVGHVGWFQEFWALRHGDERRASILPNADALYNSATVPHDARWDLPLPSFAETIAYRDQVLERVVKSIEQGDGRSVLRRARRAARGNARRGVLLHAPDVGLSGPERTAIEEWCAR